ncbi:phosphotransferase [Acetobacter persici]|uniref:phosphotransferase n=1 Tax=Acetobacter persici TaxID=1076596 RepID=UPI001BA85575|nr:phosphotransferase [Acetobacter persici]MBS1002090.1 phosphotransferase [Acetobacter persici]
MLNREDILKHIPHQGKSCLLDTCETWTDDTLTAHTSAHLRDDNPLRYQGRLGIIVGAEMAMQAAALHGALTGDQTAKTRGYLASLRDLVPASDRLDRGEYGFLRIVVQREQHDVAGMVYGFSVRSQHGAALLKGRGMVMFRARMPVNETPA